MCFTFLHNFDVSTSWQCYDTLTLKLSGATLAKIAIRITTSVRRNLESRLYIASRPTLLVMTTPQTCRLKLTLLESDEKSHG